MPRLAFSCQHCQGTGRLPDETCQSCFGIGHGIILGGYLVYWQKNLTKEEFFLDHFSLVVRLTIRLVAFLLALSGILYAVFKALLDISVGRTFVFFNLPLEDGAESLFFWVSIMAIFYIYSGLERDLANLKRIPSRVYEDEVRPQSEAASFDSRHRLNIADTLAPDVRSVLADAFVLAEKLQQPLGAIHLLFVLLRHASVRTVLARLGVNPAELGGKAGRLTALNSPAGPNDLETIFFQAYVRAYGDRQKNIDPVDLFAAVGTVDPRSREVLYDAGVDEQKIDNVLAWHLSVKRQYEQWRHWRIGSRHRPRNRLDRAMTAIATPTLDYYSQDITELAQWGMFLPTVSRGEMVDRVVRIFQGGRSAVLVGYPGVGKRGVIEELAERLAADDVPAILKDKRLVSVSIAKIVSGATPADAEARLLKLLDEVAYSGNIVLVIEEIQGAVGITSGQAGSVDMAAVLAKTLRQRRTLCLATTTPDDYKRVIERTVLSSLFERLNLDEPSINETIQIVESRVGRIEAKHRVYFSYDAIARLVELSAKYIHDRFLPQKSLSILDELALFTKEHRGQDIIMTVNDVDLFMSQKLGVPLSRVNKNEAELLLHLEDRLHERIVDQETAVTAVAEALRRARAEVRDQKRPIANLMFLGPTGVGKTELAKAVAAVYFGEQNKMVRLDMTEYQELASLSRLIGSAEGGSAARGILTEAVRSNPFALVLLDEIEKAHVDVINVFLQVMDDGRLTDSRGQTTDFTNVILIATSNAGTSFIQEAVRSHMPMPEIERQLMESELKHHFQPEFLNRFDNIIVFRPLTTEHVLDITRLMLRKVGERLAEQGVTISVSDEVIKELATLGFDPLFGARPLRRVIQEKVDSPIARLILEGRLERRDQIILESAGKLTVKKAERL
ncbi:hypothetical protein A3I40_00160 [Candidatus Uhrbacteria bacterium RIFCSPLOWO2_02_FULL_48_12]|uniref:Clp R domain-containing protein n=1 Tax=Candidatus Uhrbacteria bacterium RIFCSPLOWO2_02_FULL_48_12 TaxID=1802407 RepID=A0A1F7VA38_9BACT|nr:MAG: hypothetical protein A3I40_00160 [Candidatus Uhrbacteria bacterium RIFCSPLOWO2_02_FULL_48_12]